ncbi:hypothetical protein NPIL_270561 [Nephila pilipes]|uniref:Uncharacterized protein n=1 Tax=Nephila pilipes TaxID=299642 RepID=A0A8X6PYP2_NEPPI|nr:hypothetical protein NPIL_497761 [Nephila pilipes]GFT91132.1 hypothetical protein NPIL_270561 [Nephila pilipes]
MKKPLFYGFIQKTTTVLFSRQITNPLNSSNPSHGPDTYAKKEELRLVPNRRTRLQLARTTPTVHGPSLICKTRGIVCLVLIGPVFGWGEETAMEY